MWCMYILHSTCAPVLQCSSAPVLQTRMQRSPCQISFYFMSEFQWEYWEVSMVRGYFRVVDDTHHSCELSCGLMEKKYSAPSGRLRTEDWGNQESCCYVKTNRAKRKQGRDPWCAAFTLRCRLNGGSETEQGTAAETVQIFSRELQTQITILSVKSGERGRKSLSGEIVGNRDVNARESRRERLLNICMLGSWDGERKMATSDWEPRWFFFLSRGK